MAKNLQVLLGAREPLFSRSLAELEVATGHGAIDVRLIADITHTAHQIMRELQLDPADTTGRELYLALNAAVLHGKLDLLLGQADFVLLAPDGQPVSFNLIDVIENAHHELPYEQRTTEHGRRALRGEIVARYLAHARTDNTVVLGTAKLAGLLPEADEGHQSTTQHIGGKNMPYILAIGDIFTDAFIRLNESYAHISTDDQGNKWLNLPFGSKPPYDGVDVVRAVGPSPNAAVAFSRLGLKTGLMAYIGDDQPGKETLEYLQKERIDASTVSVQAGLPSNYYYVLRYGAERTILVKNEDYDYTWQEPAEVPDWIYLSLVSKSAWQLHEDLIAYLEAHPETRLAFQPGTFHFEWGAEKLAAMYGRSHIVVMNREEAVDVTGKPYDSLKELADGLHALGPKIVVITDGPNGSYASYDGRLVTIPNYPDPAPPVDRTGAGDAFASTIVAALARGESMDTALTWAPINSMSVVQQIGAQAGLLDEESLRKYLESAPDNYHVTEMGE